MLNQTNRGMTTIIVVLMVLIVSVIIGLGVYFVFLNKPVLEHPSPLEEKPAPVEENIAEVEDNKPPEPTLTNEDHTLPKHSDFELIQNLTTLQTAIEKSLDQIKTSPLPKPSPATWDALMSALHNAFPADASMTASDYCYYVDDLQSWYVLSTFLENPTPSDQFDLDLSFTGRNFTLISSRDPLETACPDPRRNSILACSEDTVYCLFGDNKLSPKITAQMKREDAKRIQDLKQLLAAVEVIAAGSAPGTYPTPTRMASDRNVNSVTPSRSDEAYCYYVSPNQLEYVWSVATIDDPKNADQGYDGATNTSVPKAWGVYEIKQAGGSGRCASPSADVPDCDDTSSQTYCLQGTTST